MSRVAADRFKEFFRELHGHPAYDWQLRLAADACRGEWPGAVDLPTGSGKTACIDIAIFAMAFQAAGVDQQLARAPRRVFFCVNRRVIVDEAHSRALNIARKIARAESGVLKDVAVALRSLAGSANDSRTPPLDVLELRGGVYRDNRWARSPAQPTVVCTTVDQLGSRLLFRGYGVSPNAAPIHAALIAYDSLILLDEAHISEPFRQTIERVGFYLDGNRWAAAPIGARPLVFVPMTATPPAGRRPERVVRLGEEDLRDDSLRKRLDAKKPAALVSTADVTTAAVEEAVRREPTNAAVGIIVNRVATAKAVYKELVAKFPASDIELVIGSMRPVDRDEQSERLAELVGSKRPKISEKSSFVVATQCLEVGADYDFDVLITECASLDALRQRFGRLNRGGREIAAEAVILVRQKELKPDDALDDQKPLDPIYGNALAATWNWLNSRASVATTTPAQSIEKTTKRKKSDSTDETRTIDFGIDAFNRLLRSDDEKGLTPKRLLAPSASLDAPVMLPAYLDLWCQTSPIPVPDPDVSLFLHGPQRRDLDVQVCSRADLNPLEPEENFCEIVSLLPPTSAECMSVPISRVRRWMADTSAGPADDDGDMLERASEEEEGGSKRKGRGDVSPSLKITGVLWRGAENSILLKSQDDLRPGDTLVLPALFEGWDQLGHVPPVSLGNPKVPLIDGLDDTDPKAAGAVSLGEPQLPLIDVAERAFLTGRERAAFRSRDSLRRYRPTENAAFEQLRSALVDREEWPKVGELRELLSEASNSIFDSKNPLEADLKKSLKALSEPDYGLDSEPYPDGEGAVLTTRGRISSPDSLILPESDEGDDAPSRAGSKAVTLEVHSRHVVDEMKHILETVSTEARPDLFALAAELHDLGKADERFQAWLLGADRTLAHLAIGLKRTILAKSGGSRSRSEDRQARERSGLPQGFRHEMLSVQLAERSPTLPTEGPERDLVLHLIAAHHGHARPFAPVSLDGTPPSVEFDGLSLDAETRESSHPHRLDSGIGERFWSLTRRHGWWGLAYLEALLRLADQRASEKESTGRSDRDSETVVKENRS